MQQVEMREIGPDDASAVATLLDAAAREAALENRAAPRRIDVGEARGIIAYMGGRPVGWCHAAPKADLPGVTASPLGRGSDLTQVGSIVRFFVLPEFRRQGIARRLLDAACDTLRRQGLRYAEAYALSEARRPPTEAFDRREDDEVGAQDYRGWLRMYLEAGFTIVTTSGSRFHTRTVATVRKPLDISPAEEADPLLPLRIKARFEIHEAYETIALHATANLEIWNRRRDASDKYTRRSLLLEYWNRAQAINNFATVIGLISGSEYAQFIRDFQTAHPDVVEMMFE